MDSAARTVRIAALSDLHITRASRGLLAPLLVQAAQTADIIVICGDLTDHGTLEEGEVLVRELGHIHLPIVAVFGNHDFESGHASELGHLLLDAGVKLLEGEATELLGVGFAGVKGFCGGFGRHALGPWGEPAIKSFVREALDETLKLEAALARLRSPRRIAVLHYAPIVGTVEGEPREIYPFLGTSRLEEPLVRYPVSAVFHGHAHTGSPEGRLSNGVPVYNVALPLLRRLNPEGPWYRVLELPAPLETADSPPAPSEPLAPLGHRDAPVRRP
jgi:Icc-related predicted phosphoesterase